MGNEYNSAVMKRPGRRRRIAAIVMAHLWIISLSVSCGRHDSISHDTHLFVPTPNGDFVDAERVDFFLDEEVDDGVITGWVRADGCRVWVDLCDSGYCETVFSDVIYPNEEVIFKVYSDESYVFDDYLEGFWPCYKDGGEFAQEPFSCQKWSCESSEEDLTVVLESVCEASLTADIEVTYFDERTPFKGPLLGCLWLAE